MGGGVHSQQACSKGFAHGSTEGRQHQTESTSYRNKANKIDYFIVVTIIKDEESIVFRAIDPGRLTTLRSTAPCPRVYG